MTKNATISFYCVTFQEHNYRPKISIILCYNNFNIANIIRQTSNYALL